MSNILRLCQKCQTNPATIQCIDCEEKMCYSCDQKVHQKLKQHKTDIIPYSQMKQIKSTSFIISGIKDHSNISQELQQELNELEAMIEAKKSFLMKQEEKWSTQISFLETQYENKLQQFEKEIQSNEDQFKDHYSSGNTKQMIADLKKQMEAQKQQAWKELNDKKLQLQEKENILNEMIKAEQYCSKEIAQKEKLIEQYKDYLQKLQAERELIKQENEKIMKQLESIKLICKKSLPDFGINVDFLDKLVRVKKNNNNTQVEEQDEEYEEENEEEEEGENQNEEEDEVDNQNEEGEDEDEEQEENQQKENENEQQKESS